MPDRYTHIGPTGRVYRLYGCAKRGCDRITTDYESFGADDKSYCRDTCIPRRYRLKLWSQKRHYKGGPPDDLDCMCGSAAGELCMGRGGLLGRRVVCPDRGSAEGDERSGHV
jgi:hypothetical protein